MAGLDWEEVLQDWNDRWLASSEAGHFPEEVRNAKWLGFPPATDAQIEAAEKRLGLALPPSYRAFLKVSNGWRQLTDAIDRVWGTEEITWFKKNHRDWIAAFTEPMQSLPDETPDEEYYSYVQSESFKPSHLKETLQISEVGDAAVLLLNPQVIGQDGEWELYFLANWVPGVERYRSFAEWIESSYQHFLNRGWKQPVGLINGLPNEYIGAPGSPKRRLRKRRRRQVAKLFGEPLDQWAFDDLVRLLHHDDANVVCEVAKVVGKRKEPRFIEPLLALVKDHRAGCVEAMWALKDLVPERLREPLLEILRKRSFRSNFAAAVLLAELQELRAVPIVVEMVRDTSPDQRHICDYAGQHLARFGAAGFDALVELLESEEPVVRQRAVNALYYSRDPRTIDLHRRLLTHGDPNIRERAKQTLGLLHAPE